MPTLPSIATTEQGSNPSQPSTNADPSLLKNSQLSIGHNNLKSSKDAATGNECTNNKNKHLNSKGSDKIPPKKVVYPKKKSTFL